MNFYLLPSKQCVVSWSQKCACTAISRWIKRSFDEGRDCPKTKSMRAYLAKAGLQYKDPSQLKELTSGEQPAANKIIISYRDPASRITSTFVNKFHVYENRPIFDGTKKIQKFSKKFSTDLSEDLNRHKDTRREKGDFSLREMILFLWKLKRRGSLDSVDPHFKPQLLDKNQLDSIKSCSGQHTRLFPLKVESLNSDLKYINDELDFNYFPPYINSTSLPTDEWSFSNSAELVDIPLSKLYADKVIPKSGSLREALKQDQELNRKYMDIFQHDYELLRWMDGLREIGNT